ncbi:MAG TPA: hypothetical protein VFF52_17935 [Isosphaeraceae bacterium]|nr:hypothetical protein [Isosphaeraceae bacterium]
MPRTTLCKQCGVILNIPDRATAGKRLRCPKCGLRFVVTVADASSESTLPGPADADTLSRFDMEARPPSQDDLPVPVAEKDLRETFDIPLISARDAERAEVATSPAVGDAAALFDDRAGPRRRMSAADARAKPRRCSNCGGLVPQGMSICVSCGVDQETGLRIGLEDDLAPPPPPRPQGPPMHIAVIGGLCGVAGLILLIASVIQSVGGAGGWQNYAWLCLALVSAFGIYGSVEFIRGRSAKLLMLALSLGVMIDLTALVGIPLVRTFWTDQERIITEVHSTSDEEVDTPGIGLVPYQDRLDVARVKVGFVLVFIYAILSVYLMSPPVKKYVHSSRAEKSPWGPL